jgi:hypothetical protein
MMEAAEKRKQWLEAHPALGVFVLDLIIGLPLIVVFLGFGLRDLRLVIGFGALALFVGWLCGYAVLKRNPTGPAETAKGD